MKKISSLILFVFCSTSSLFAQKLTDIDLLLITDFDKSVYDERVVTYGFSENPSKLALFNPIYHVLSSAMYIYQKFISPQLATECTYNPSCSAYSKQLIKDHGIAKGVFCSADRLMRCNRIAISGLPHSAFDERDRKVHESTDRYSLKKKKRNK
ncbi:MAG: membrane protein insertion efficiency factor YidD [Bacteroidales bacterium]|nr:membrane protein insertion efficiency factor YidD [Bacteroidales bacterium]